MVRGFVGNWTLFCFNRFAIDFNLFSWILILISVWNRWTIIRLFATGIRLLPHESKGTWVSLYHCPSTNLSGSRTLSIWFVFADGRALLYGTIYLKIQTTNRWIGCRHASDSIVRPKSIRISSPTTITKAIQPIQQSIQYTKCKRAHHWFWCFVRCKPVLFIFTIELNNVKGHLAHTKDRTTRNIIQLSRFRTVALQHSPYLFARHIGWCDQLDGLGSLVANEMPESWECSKSPQYLNSACADVALTTNTVASEWITLTHLL